MGNKDPLKALTHFTLINTDIATLIDAVKAFLRFMQSTRSTTLKKQRGTAKQREENKNTHHVLL